MALKGLKYFFMCFTLCFLQPVWAQTDKSKAELDVSRAELLAQRDEPIVLANSDYKSVAVSFDPSFLRAAPYGSINVSQFEQDKEVIAGRYMADLYVNERYQGSDEFIFKAFADSEQPRLCVNKVIIMQLGLDETIEQTALTVVGDQACVMIRQALPGVKYAFDMKKLRLSFYIPQIMLSQTPRGFIAPELWDKGSYAASLSYDLNSYVNKTNSQGTDKSYFAGLRSSVHMQSWALRHDGSWSKSGDQAGSYQRNNTYLETEIAPLKSSFKLGEFYSGIEFFDGVKVRGAELASDEQMLPQSVRSYAPVVRGTAGSNAKVTISQSDRLVYETTVSEGAFEIRDLYPSGSGDLEVTVEEAGGQIKRFIVPYSYVPDLIRPGAWRYGSSLGEVQINSSGRDSDRRGKNVVQGYLKHGLTNNLTLNTAALHYPDYQTLMLGGAVNTPYGAFSLDNYLSRSQLDGQSSEQGQRWRLAYSKFIQPSATYISANYNRYSEKGIHSLNTFISRNGSAQSYDWDWRRYSLMPKENYSFSVNQTLPETWGSVYVSASESRYWQQEGKDQTWQFGYANSFKRINYDVSYAKTRNINFANENQISVSITIPLGYKGNHSVRASSVHSDRYTDSNRIGLSGNLVDNKVNYGVYANNNGSDNSYSGNLGYYGSAARLSATTSHASSSSQYSLGAAGSIVAYPRGVIMSQSIGDSFVIIEADNAQGAEILNRPGTYLNRFGKGVVPYVSPYEINTINLSPKNTNLDVVLQQTQKQLVPRGHTASLVRFNTETRRTILLTVNTADNQAVPMGAEVFDAQDHSLGFVASSGRLFLEAKLDAATLNARWGNNQCAFNYDIAQMESAKFYRVQTVTCQ